MTTLRASVRAVRRYLLARQGLLASASAVPWRKRLAGADGVAEAIRRLEAVQVDPVSAVAPNHHLVLAARVGRYDPSRLESLYPAGRVFEYASNARCILPAEDLPAYAVVMEHFWTAAAARREREKAVLLGVLAALDERPGLSARQLGQRTEAWSAGYMPAEDAPDADSPWIPPLGLLLLGGRIAVSRRAGNEKGYAVTERLFPATLVGRMQEARAAYGRDAAGTLQAFREFLLEKYLRAFGVFSLADPRFGWRRMGPAAKKAAVEARVRAGRLVALEIEGVRRAYFAPPEAADAFPRLEADEPTPLVTFLPPLDNLLWSRSRLADLFGFEYTWEVYVPPSKRVFGHYAMPILEGDRLIGRMDPRLDRRAGRLRILRLDLEPHVAAGPRRARRIGRALDAFTGTLGAGDWTVERTRPEDLVRLLAR